MVYGYGCCDALHYRAKVVEVQGAHPAEREVGRSKTRFVPTGPVMPGPPRQCEAGMCAVGRVVRAPVDRDVDPVRIRHGFHDTINTESRGTVIDLDGCGGGRAVAGRPGRGAAWPGLSRSR